jgi:hypothetical protein
MKLNVTVARIDPKTPKMSPIRVGANRISSHHRSLPRGFKPNSITILRIARSPPSINIS